MDKWMNERQGDTILSPQRAHSPGGRRLQVGEKTKQRYKYLHENSEWEETDGGWAANMSREPAARASTLYSLGERRLCLRKARCAEGGGVST